MQLHWLSYLIAVSDAGSISKAARRLYLNQQHLSKIIVNVENDLDTKIFDRNTYGVQVTDKGKLIIDWARSVIDSYNELVSTLHPDSLEEVSLSQHLHIQCIPSNVNDKYVKVLNQFTSYYPNITVTFDENPSEDIIANVTNKSVDIGICFLYPEFENLSDIISEETLYIPCYRGKMAIFVPPHHHLAATHKQISMKDLQNETFLIYNPNSSEFTLSLKTMKFFSEYVYKTKFSISNLDTYYELLNTGNYVHLGSTSNFTQLSKKGLIMIPISDSIICETGIVVRKDMYDLPVIHKFIEIYLQSFKD